MPTIVQWIHIFHLICIHGAFVVTKRLTQCMQNTKETNSFNTIKCTILQSYTHSTSPTYTAYSSELVMLLLYLNSYSTSNVISTNYAVYIPCVRKVAVHLGYGMHSWL